MSDQGHGITPHRIFLHLPQYKLKVLYLKFGSRKEVVITYMGSSDNNIQNS